LHVILGESQKKTPPTWAAFLFYCPIQITGLGDDDFVQPIFRVDGFQAIELALRFIGWRLSDINANNVGRLRWQFGDNGKLPKEWAQKEP
jgi:hypothetical protein